MTSLNKKIGAGIAWNLANILISRGASIVFTLFLARFLAPDAFGLMAMVAICYALADALMTAGFGQSIIRQKTVTDLDLSTAFFANLALSVLLYIALFFAAPSVATFYEQPALVPLVRVTGLVLFVNCLKVVQLALLNRAMAFKALMRANSTATLVAGLCAVAMAYAGLGVWSLVAQFMIAAAVSTLLMWSMSSWRPQLIFSGRALREMFGFGSKLTVESVLNVLYENAYVLVIGRFFSAEATGLYYFAKRIRDLAVDQTNAAVQQATYPAMARMQDDNTELKRMYRNVLQLLFFVITPALLCLAVLALPLFELAFHERWLPAAPYLQLLCVAGVLFPVHSVNLNMFKVRGRSDLVLSVGVVRKTLHLILLAVSIPYGISGILASQIVATVLSCPPYMYYATKLIDYKIGEQLADIGKPVIAAIVAALTTYYVLASAELAPLMHAAGGAALFTALYLIAAHISGAEGYVLIRQKLISLRAIRAEKGAREARV